METSSYAVPSDSRAPPVLGFKPRQKYFSAGTYGSLENAKCAALGYRDAKLSVWLSAIDHKYK